MRALFWASFADAEGDVQAGKTVTLYESDGTTPLSTAVYAASSGSTLATLTTDGNGELTFWSNVAKPIQVAVSGRSTKVPAVLLADRSRDAVWVTDFGAVGDGVTDDTAAIQAAITYAESLLAELYFPAGSYIHTGLTSAKRITWRGAGAARSILTLAATVSSTTDALTVTALASGATGSFAGRFCDLSLRAGSAGRHAVNLDCSADNTSFVHLAFERCFVQNNVNVSASRAVMLTPDSSAPTAGLTECSFDDCLIDGGMKLLAAFDQCYVDRTLFSGANVGIELSTVSGAGKWDISRSTFVTTSNALWIKNPTIALSLRGNYFEPAGAITGGSGRAVVVDLDSDTAGAIQHVTVSDNLFGLGSAGAATGIRARNTADVILGPNDWNLADAGSKGIDVDSTCTGTIVRRGNVVLSGAGTLVSNGGETDLLNETRDKSGEITLGAAGSGTETVTIGTAVGGLLVVHVVNSGDEGVGTLHAGAAVVTSISATNIGGAGTGIVLATADPGTTTGIVVYHNGTAYAIKNRAASSRTVRWRLVGLA